jgi:hypothetical protein
VDQDTDLLPHPVENLMDIPAVPLRARAETPSKLLQVYVDNFCHAATQSADRQHLPKVRRAAIHGVHAVFPETDVTEHTNGKEPILRNKVEKGDGNFETLKTLIGFILDGIKRTVCLPEEKIRLYIKEAHAILIIRKIPIKTLQTMVGKL